METSLVEPLPNLNESPQPIVKVVRKPFITKENAKRLQLLGSAKRLQMKVQHDAEVASVEADIERIRPLMAKAVELTTLISAQPELEYRLQRLARTREQLSKLDGLLESAKDWKAAKAICEAIARLSVIEGNLAGRPLPGSRRPGREKPERGQGASSSPAVDE